MSNHSTAARPVLRHHVSYLSAHTRVSRALTDGLRKWSHYEMLSDDILYRVEQETLEYWTSEVSKDYFIDIAQGKEIGHKLADLVDEKTTALLTVNHRTGYQLGNSGNRRARSMGDVWLHDSDIYHPVNVKTGVVGSEGQPNLVSLKKVLSALTAREIDSYYLLIVKIAISEIQRCDRTVDSLY